LRSTNDTDWEYWAADWQALDPVKGDPGTMCARVRQKDMRLWLIRIAEGALALMVSAGVGLAIAHAPAPEDLLRGAVVVAIVLVITGVRLLAHWFHPAASNSTTTFLELSLRNRQRQVQGLGYAWLLITLKLLFLIPWWMDGYRIHREAVGSLAFISAWLPTALILGLLVWTMRRWLRLREEIAELRELQHHFIASR
jgi:hypothetical protein